jgi:hypothetical protein
MSQAVEHLRSNCDEETLVYLRKLYDRDPDWGDEMTPEQRSESEKKYGFSIPAPFHFGTGMQIRNCLREVIRDDQLPGVQYGGEVAIKLEGDKQVNITQPEFEAHNWDDWYISVVERMIGVG